MILRIFFKNSESIVIKIFNKNFFLVFVIIGLKKKQEHIFCRNTIKRICELTTNKYLRISEKEPNRWLPAVD